MHRSPSIYLLAAIGLFAAGCSSYYNHYDRSAAREIQEILDAARPGAVDEHVRNARMPQPEVPAGPPRPGTPPDDGRALPKEHRVLSLRDALKTATEMNRDFKSEREALYFAALSLSLERHRFDPILSSTISYIYSGGSSATGTGTASGRLGVRQLLPTGGTITASTDASRKDNIEHGGTVSSHGFDATFQQPLLRGFGSEVAYANLTQAERDVIYALRDFEQYRRDFTIGVVRRYYDILRQKQVVNNSRHTLEQFTFLRRRSESLFEVGKVSAIDKFRAAQEELTASNDLLAEQETLAQLLDGFRVYLGLGDNITVDVGDEPPEAKPVNIDLRSAVEAALHNRLDLKTSADMVEDAERAVRVAQNGLLPDLDLTATIGMDGTDAGGPMRYASSHSVGLALVLPLNKTADRNAYKRAMLLRSQRRRAHDLATENVKLQVMNSYRRLRRLANTVSIQRDNLALAERRVDNARVRFEQGQLGNREVVEAQSAKLRAQNALIGAVLDHEVTRLQLKRDIGILFVDNEGMWIE